MEFQRILVRATNWVGDAVMCVPAMAEIRRRFPEAKITLLARPWVAGLYDRTLVDEIMPYTLGRGWRDLAGKWRLAKELRGMDFDCAILLPNAFEAAAIAWLARIPVRIGYARDGRGLLLTDPIAPPGAGETEEHQRFYYLELLRRAGLIERIPAVEEIRLPGIPMLESEGVRLFLERGIEGPFVGVSPGAAFGGAKRWLPERFAEAALRVAKELDAGVAIFGSADERTLCGTVLGLVREAGVRAHNFAGETSLEEFVALAAACDAFITNDSGAMHVASALGVPTVAVFGATDHVATGPTGPLARVVREPVECSPCLLRECPIDHRCMTGVSAERVAGELQELVRLARQ
jgi:heptosyltransferase II